MWLKPGYSKDFVNSFSGLPREINSPNNQFTLRYVDGPDINGNDPMHSHQLFLMGQPPKLIKSGLGNVDVLWAPDSMAFILNDWIGSNLARAYVYRIGDLEHPIALLPTAWDKQDDNKFVCSTLYIYGSKWVSPTVVELKVSGHSETVSGFTLIYRWQFDGPSKLIKRLSKEDSI